MRYFKEHMSGASILNWTRALSMSEIDFTGVLLPGNVHVAVKMLTSSSRCNGEEFISEVSTVGRIHHVNVVRLVGFCSEEMRRALVYEYMPRGSLDKYIFSSDKSFSWDMLNEIALGIARGINYLHQCCDMQILHFDIKPHNILLDSNFVPKVADFGLAKLYPRDKSFVPVSAARGTIGYIAPEMISRSFGVISSKSDVYSFGMLLLEMAGGRRNADPNAANSSQAYYPSRVYSQLTRRHTTGEISDIADMHELEKKLCVVGLWCIQMKSCDRATMSEVIEMLEGGIDSLQVPPRPFFCDDEQTPRVESHHLSSDLTAISEEQEDDDDENIYWTDPDQSPEKDNATFQQAMMLAGSEFMESVHFHIDSAHGNFICLTLKRSLKLILSLSMYCISHDSREVGAQNGDWKMAVPMPWCEDSSESEEREIALLPRSPHGFGWLRPAIGVIEVIEALAQAG
ncbi:hypothetical protein GUJ93_ZPchr0009g162 [Zizania palustris]|uniref:Protein kinase domain-containing protein n=1 Tax=Zizania palustris TaxID=103762 RepID=A0A8J5RBD0_ZIZPA|nr:hypothetical protein GUJ93_ZPchr0009g162 [Zizania palustris]